MPQDFSAEALTWAELVLDTTSAKAGATAYIYAADYSAFTNGTQYEGVANAPSYTAKEFNFFTSPSSAGTTKINVTGYVKTLNNSENAAFRIDMKNQDLPNGFQWLIGSCTNSGRTPQLVLTYDTKNMSFNEGTKYWTVSGDAQVKNEDGNTFIDISPNGKVSRTMEGLENGSYTLKADVRRQDIAETSYVYAKIDGVPKIKRQRQAVANGVKRLFRALKLKTANVK